MDNKYRAHKAVTNAVLAGRMEPASAHPCADCQGFAHEYHHESYEQAHWLDVIPLCRKCHSRRHPSKRRSMTDEQAWAALEMRQQLKTVQEIAREIGVSSGAIWGLVTNDTYKSVYQKFHAQEHVTEPIPAYLSPKSRAKPKARDHQCSHCERQAYKFHHKREGGVITESIPVCNKCAYTHYQGRTRSISDEQAFHILGMHSNGLDKSDISSQLQISESIVHQITTGLGYKDIYRKFHEDN